MIIASSLGCFTVEPRELQSFSVVDSSVVGAIGSAQDGKSVLGVLVGLEGSIQVILERKIAQKHLEMALAVLEILSPFSYVSFRSTSEAAKQLTRRMHMRCPKGPMKMVRGEFPHVSTTGAPRQNRVARQTCLHVLDWSLSQPSEQIRFRRPTEETAGETETGGTPRAEPRLPPYSEGS